MLALKLRVVCSDLDGPMLEAGATCSHMVPVESVWQSLRVKRAASSSQVMEQHVLLTPRSCKELRSWPAHIILA